MRFSRTRDEHDVIGIEPTGLTLGGVIDEVAATLTARPKRTVLTAMGTVLGVGTLVAILGLTATASGQVSARFDALAATTVEIVDARSPGDPTASPLDDDAIARVRGLNGVSGAGLLYAPRAQAVATSANPQHRPMSIPIWAASSQTWQALEPTMSSGRVFDRFSENAPVVVLGAGAAAQLGVDARVPTAITIDDHPFTVMGVFSLTVRRPELRMGIIVPAPIAAQVWGSPTPDDHATVVVATRPGAARQVAAESRRVAALAHPELITISDPPDPRSLRDAISDDLASLFFALALIGLILGAVGISNTTLVAVMERRAEIGLRRALGARSRDIAAQIMCESATIGLLGGVAGSAAGMGAILIVALIREWTPLADPVLLALAPALGWGIGVISGLYPTWKAVRIEPTQALRDT